MLLSLLPSVLLISGPMSKKKCRAAALLSRVDKGFKLVNRLGAVLLSLLQLTAQCILTTTTTMNLEVSAVLLNPRLLLLRPLLHLRQLVPRLLLLRPLLHLRHLVPRLLLLRLLLHLRNLVLSPLLHLMRLVLFSLGH